jgi:DNA-binding winged helix-turn-helix (wHTH) protein
MFQFEGYTLDIGRHSLRAADREVTLRPKSFEVLRYLVENPDRLVTKEELLKAIWPNVVVTEEALTHCMREVRQALGDSKQTIIATVPRYGYRFAAPVLRLTPNPAVAPRAHTAPSVLVGDVVPPLATPTAEPSPAEPRYSEGSATQQSDRSRQQPTSVGGGDRSGGSCAISTPS